MLQSMAKKAGISKEKAEEYWKKAKEIAAKAGRDPEKTKKDGDWAYVTGIVKKMMKLEWVEFPKPQFPMPPPYAPPVFTAAKLIDDVVDGQDAAQVINEVVGKNV
jgi:hypothetical protein